MAKQKKQDEPTVTPPAAAQLEQGTYEIIRNRLRSQGEELRKRMDQLNEARRGVFGAVETRLLATEHVTTENNCIARDMVPVGNVFLFGYNVHFGLKTEINIQDVFGVYRYDEQKFTPEPLDLINDQQFEVDFKNLYKYYRDTEFAKFAAIGPNIYMVFKVGKTVNDIKAFKWVKQGNSLQYIDNRSEHEVKYPDQHEFKWKRTTRDQHRDGLHPHVSINDKVFVETVGGDLTIKVEDNTTTGAGIYAEPVDNAEQTLDDAEIFYAIVGNIIILKIRPYQEAKYRYIVFNQKIQKAVRIDSLEDSCVLLPDSHGIIFSQGYYLQTGEYKVFDHDGDQFMYEKKLASPNGEDFLYVFYRPDSGEYLLLNYNLIKQQVETPVFCQGYSIFDNGEMCYFRTSQEQQKHHAVQIWQTPFYGPNFEVPRGQDHYLYKVGNKDLVRAMAESKELLTLLEKEDSYLNLYVDLVKKSGVIRDSFHWINNAEAFNLGEPLKQLQETASSAIEEFERVTRIRKNTAEAIDTVTKKADEAAGAIKRATAEDINHFVKYLAELRTLRGEIISLKELRYADLPRIEQYEKLVAELNDKLSEGCVQFLLRKDSLKPYENKVEELKVAIEKVGKVADADKIDEDIKKTSSELEMLIEIVSNLKITDATETTRIIDNISSIYSRFNQVKATLKQKRKELSGVEGKAEFNAQLKLIEQAVINYLDLCDKPEKCEQYLNRLMVQLEELEGRFSEFEEFQAKLGEKREEIYNAFESRKVALIEQVNRRTGNLAQSAERILKGIGNRAATFTEVSEINGYFASDLMVDKVRDAIKQLQELGDSVKADDIQGRLKTVQEDTIRQLKDKKELFKGGPNTIQFGKHFFNTNTQPLDLTVITRDGEMYYHLTGTNFFEKIKDDRFLATREVWDQTILSENDTVYRSEYLAYKFLEASRQNHNNTNGTVPRLEDLYKLTEKQLQEAVQQFMAPRFNESYVKGVHDHDATIMVTALLKINQNADLLRYPTVARACAALYWHHFAPADKKKFFNNRLKGVGAILQVFPDTREFGAMIKELQGEIQHFVNEHPLYEEAVVTDAGEYLFHEIVRGDHFIIDRESSELYKDFLKYLGSGNSLERFEQSIKAVHDTPAAAYKLIRKWLRAFVESKQQLHRNEYISETAVLILSRTFDETRIVNTSLKMELTGMVGSHPMVEGGKYLLNYNTYQLKLRHFEGYVVPLYQAYTQLKKQLTTEFSEQLRLSEFKPKVLTSFVRNKLINNVYLPLIGDNLAKQIGVAGENTRTDRMGLLLLISPPGYGKTTIMEYIANRLGIIFMKINGPAIGHSVTSLDPEEAPNANAREELEKLNLSFEMGDNVMIYVDDIQHCNPEFLQKFISLCDAQRKIEGVYKGRTKTYDFRGRKVCVVMAGNPYTESGERFRIPDMLANRADIYNLGDIIGDTATDFKASYIENSLSANPVLGRLSTKSQNDLYPILKLAETGDGEGMEFEANHSSEEISEYVSVLKKLIIVRDVILKVNQAYIHSAGQSEDYRTEPAFRLQGSYRDMNKIGGRIMPVMNDAELDTLIMSHYVSESQTLTRDAEANLLKFKELIGKLTKDEAARWESIKETFRKNQKFLHTGGDNPMGQVVLGMDSINEGLTGIAKALEDRHKT